MALGHRSPAVEPYVNVQDNMALEISFTKKMAVSAAAVLLPTSGWVWGIMFRDWALLHPAPLRDPRHPPFTNRVAAPGPAVVAPGRYRATLLT